jgi:pseudaminic acid cytidylyltransferase
VIPARGGSKRIPGKNIRPFCGKPIIAYSIEAARESGVFDRILVSTDDSHIATVARDYGAETPFVRPAGLSDDWTPTVPVIRHAVDWAADHWGNIESACCIYSTAPFVTSLDLRKAYATLTERQVSGYVFSAAAFAFPIQRAFRITSEGHCDMFQPDNYAARSQDLEPAYQDAGQFYWGSARCYRSNDVFFAPDSVPHIIPRHRVQDIDTPEDWQHAELLWEVLQRRPVAVD